MIYSPACCKPAELPPLVVFVSNTYPSVRQAGFRMVNRMYRQSFGVIGRRAGIALLSILLITCCLSDPGWAQDAVRPSSRKKNVLLLIADDLSPQALGCFGNRECQTPNIDSLAKRGMRFEHAFCQYPVCGPSRAAMMSGMYCQSIGVMGNGQSSRFTENLGTRPSMSQLFKNRGWYTARVSKIYHMRVPGDITAGVDGPDHAASWTERFNCQAPEWMSKGKHEHLTNVKLRFDKDKHYNLGFGGAFYTVRIPGRIGADQADKLAADKAIELLRSHGQSPFFLAVGFVRPHVPLVAPEPYFDRYPWNGLSIPRVPEGDWDDIPRAGIIKNSRAIGLDSKEKKQKVLQAYYASVSFMDYQVGRVLNELKKLGLMENTIVIFKSDHGYHLGEHDFWQKMSLHEESTRIPLIISVPGMPGNRASQALVQAIDLYPTLAELQSFPIPKHCQGKSLVRLFDDPNSKIHDAVFSTTGKGDLVRTTEFAYIRYRDQSEELYDMRSDRQQLTNLADSAEYQTALKDCRTLLEAHLARVRK